MAELIQIIVIAVVQGLLEFLPISSSGHLIIISRLFDWEDHGLLADAAVHFGSLLAVLFYFRASLASLIRSRARQVTFDGGERVLTTKLILVIALGTIPLVAVGAGIQFILDGFPASLRSPLSVGITLLITGVILASTLLVKRSDMRLPALPEALAFAIGVAQAVAVLPGISRSGATIACGIWGGLSRKSAAHFSLLLAIPALLGAGGVAALQGIQQGEAMEWFYIAIAVAISAVVSLVSVNILMAVLQRASLLPFAVYSLVAGTVIIILAVSLWS